MIDSVAIAGGGIPFFYKAVVPAGEEVEVRSKNYSINFSEHSLFEPLYLTVRDTGNQLVINKEVEPLRSSINIDYKPLSNGDIFKNSNGHLSYIGGKKEVDKISFSTRELGVFEINSDTISPTIKWAEHSKAQLKAYISDKDSGIKSFRAFVNGQWVLMNYEYKENKIWSEKLDDSVPFEGSVQLEVTDRAGNVAVSNVEIVELIKKQPVRKAPVKKTPVKKK